MHIIQRINRFIRKALAFLFVFYGLVNGAYADSPVVAYGIKQTLRSEILGADRPLSIYLPKGYHTDNKPYPVIYVLDGEFLFEPTVTITKLRAARELMPESIIVGVPNLAGFERLEMMAPLKREKGGQANGNGDPVRFLSFLESELLPFIDNQYRTASHRTLIGMSPTSDPVTQAYIRGTEAFDAFVVLAAHVDFYLSDDSLLADRLLAAATKRNDKQSWLYIGVADRDLVDPSRGVAVFNKLQSDLKALVGPAKAQLEVAPNTEHYASAINGLTGALQMIYPRDRVLPTYSDFLKAETPAAAYRAFYDDLSKEYGFQFYPLVDGFWNFQTLAGFANSLISQKKYQQAAQLSQWGLETYPDSARLWFRLATAQEALGDKAAATDAMQRAYDLSVKQNSDFSGFLKQQLERLSKQEEEKSDRSGSVR